MLGVVNGKCEALQEGVTSISSLQARYIVWFQKISITSPPPRRMVNGNSLGVGG